MSVTLNLIVLRCANIRLTKQFYELLGLEFVEEKHDEGPVHYSSKIGGCVFELYPVRRGQDPCNNRLGFGVNDLESLLREMHELGVEIPVRSINDGPTQVAIVRDPDNRNVELHQNNV